MTEEQERRLERSARTYIERARDKYGSGKPLSSDRVEKAVRETVRGMKRLGLQELSDKDQASTA